MKNEIKKWPEPEYPFRTIKNRYGHNPGGYWQRCVECGFKSIPTEEIRHYQKCNFLRAQR